MPPIDISDSDSDTEQTTLSQATAPPSSQTSILVLSDDDEFEEIPTTSSPNRRTAERSDDDDDDDIDISSPKKIVSKGKGKARAEPFEVDLAWDSGSDLPDANNIAVWASRNSNSSSSYPTKRRYSQATTFAERADSDETPSPPKKTRVDVSGAARPTKGRARKTDEQKAREKEDKDRQKELKKAEKEKLKADKQKAKEDKADHKKANQIVTKKADTLKDMTLVLSDSFRSTSLHSLLQPKIREHHAESEFERDPLANYATVRWKRCVWRKYNTFERAFEPVKPPYQVEEKVAVLLLSITQLRTLVQNNGLHDLIRRFRGTRELGPKGQIFVMVIGLEKLRKSKVGEWTRLDGALTKLEFDENTFPAYVESDEQAVDRLFNYSADLGLKEQKLVERSYLPFCPDTRHVKKGKDLKTIWAHMIDEVHRVTSSAAEGIVAEHPTTRKLLKNYERLEDNPQAAQRLLAECKVDYRRDGQKTASGRGHDKLGQALSKRVHTVLTGTDHLELVVKDK